MAAEPKARILVIEDEGSIRKLIRVALSGEEYAVTETESGQKGLELLAHEPFDLLVLDLMLPDLSGWQVLEEMRRNGLRSRVKVLILTAQSQERDILRGWRLEVDQYCMKPFEPDRFVTLVDETLTATREDLARHRESELDKAQLLHLVDSVFGDSADAAPRSSPRSRRA